MKNGTLYIPGKTNKLFNRPTLMAISYRHLFIMAVNEKLWLKDSEVAAEPIGKCFNKLFRHCCF